MWEQGGPKSIEPRVASKVDLITTRVGVARHERPDDVGQGRGLLQTGSVACEATGSGAALGACSASGPGHGIAVSSILAPNLSDPLPQATSQKCNPKMQCVELFLTPTASCGSEIVRRSPAILFSAHVILVIVWRFILLCLDLHISYRPKTQTGTGCTLIFGILDY